MCENLTEIACVHFEQIGFENGKNANSARHTAKSVIRDRILREMYTTGFDKSLPIEGAYGPLQRVKSSLKSTAQIWSKSTLKITKTLIQPSHHGRIIRKIFP